MKELFSNPTSGEAMYREVSEDSVRPLTEEDTDIIEDILEHSKTFYPEQYSALMKAYAKSSANQGYYHFLMARRVINCCIGIEKHQPILPTGRRRYGPIACPMKSECKYFKTICQPKFSCELSNRELEVMKLYIMSIPTESIADQLYLSIHTVRNHRRNVLSKLNLHSMVEFLNFAHENKLFE